jgi:predicted Zn-dependent protease
MSTARDTELQTKECAFLEGVRRRCPDFLPVLETLGDLYTKQGKIEEGLEVDLKLTSMSPENEMYHYNLACSYALMNQPTKAFSALTEAINLGYRDLEWLMKDKDIQAVRKLPEFTMIVTALKGKLKTDQA